MKKSKLKITAFALSMFIASVNGVMAQQKQTSPPLKNSASSTASSIAVKPTQLVVDKKTNSNSLSIGGFTFATKSDYDKVAAIIKTKTPAIITEKELRELNIIAVKAK